MRLEKPVDLGESRTVTVRELAVGQVRNAVAAVQTGALDFDLAALIAGDIQAELAKLGDCIELHGVDVDALTFSELETIWEAFREVNKAFLSLLAKLGLDLGVEIRKAAAGSSTGSAAPLSSEDTQTSSNTAGASS